MNFSGVTNNQGEGKMISLSSMLDFVYSLSKNPVKYRRYLSVLVA